MYLYKKITVAALSICIAFGSFQSVIAAQKTSSWATSYVEEADAVGIIPKNFENMDLTHKITRVDFCELAYNTINKISQQNSVKVTYTLKQSHFYDTDNSAVLDLYRMGIISGKTSTRFAPDDFLTRQEAALILDKTAEFLSLTRFSNTNRFSDSRQISEWAYDSVDVVCGMNIMGGMGDGTFNPSGNYTYEQAITTMVKLMGAVSDGSKEKVDNDLFFLNNDYYYWVENSSGKVLFKLSKERYLSVSFYSNGTEIIAFASLKGNEGTDAYSSANGKKLFSIPAQVCGTYADKRIIVSKADDNSKLYGVYNFEGGLVLPIEYSWGYLYENGYVGTQNPW